MKSIAEAQRARTIAQVLALPVRERIALALALGDDDLALYVRSSGLAPFDAKRRLRAQRQRGRVPSACAATPEP